MILINFALYTSAVTISPIPLCGLPSTPWSNDTVLGPYAKVEKIPMDPYKLEYFTLNPSVTLGGGHFGIVRRGFCTVLPDRYIPCYKRVFTSLYNLVGR